MRRIVDFKEIENCNEFWLDFLCTCFNGAIDKKTDETLYEFIETHYDLSKRRRY